MTSPTSNCKGNCWIRPCFARLTMKVSLNQSKSSSVSFITSLARNAYIEHRKSIARVLVSRGDVPEVAAKSLPTSLQHGPFGAPSYLGTLGLRMPAAILTLVHPRAAAYRKNLRRMAHCDATVRGFHPPVRLISMYWSISRILTDDRSELSALAQSRNRNTLDLLLRIVARDNSSDAKNRRYSAR